MMGGGGGKEMFNCDARNMTSLDASKLTGLIGVSTRDQTGRSSRSVQD